LSHRTDAVCSADTADPNPNDGVCESGPFDQFCSIETYRGCTADSDCNPPSCADCQSGQICGGGLRNCFLDPIVRTGTAGTQNSVVAATFCIPPTSATAVNAVAGLPGPGALLQPTRTFRSGANCGNGVVDAGEQCDDGNRVDGDCCSSFCRIEPAGTTCRPAAGACDVAEVCNGTTDNCPADGFKAATTECREAAGECDVAEHCSGAGVDCPADEKITAGTACTDDGRTCTTDLCDGTSPVCQHVAGNAGMVCRPAADVCDLAETCDGMSEECPADAFAPATTECRPAAGECDAADFCTGDAAGCPNDARQPSGTACTDDENPCTLDVCDGSAVPSSLGVNPQLTIMALATRLADHLAS